MVTRPRPDSIVDHIATSLWVCLVGACCGEERGGVRCCEQEVIRDRYDFDVWDADHRCYSGTASF
jgi:hypothetical protein